MNFFTHLKNYVLLLTIISFSFSAYAQTEECGFKYTPEAQRYYNSVKENIKILEQQFLNTQLASRNSTALNSVPVKAHIVRTTSGVGGLSTFQLDQAMGIMNTVYADAGLEFFLCDGINYIDDDNFYDYETIEESAMTSVNNVDGVINIYFTNSVTSSNSGGSLCGYAYFPGGAETILMANGCATNGSTLSHEMGHFFALSHTHGNSNTPGSTQELVDGSNCDNTGDFICDTAADPQLGYGNVNFNCDYTGFAQDANFDYYQPDPNNLMSYSRKECRSIFSAQQLARINAVYQVSRSSMECPSFNIDFVADETQSCATNLTVNFTDNSIGATSWDWDVNGDDIIDYTTQNVTHTYNSAGDYDVVLTISDGNESISKVKTEYIDVGADQIGTTTINMSLTLDNWPAETTWQFLDGDDNVLYSGGPYVEGTDDFTTITESFVVSNDQCYSYVIVDSYGDGICCASGNGNYELRADDNTLLASGGDFGFGNQNNLFNGVLSVNEFRNENLSLYPNPSSSTLTIKTPTLPETYSIYNTLGQVVSQIKIISETDLDINVENLTNGVYFIKLTKDNSSQVLRFIKN